MIRFLLSLLFYIALGRWIYAEALLLLPSSIPYIDSVIERVEIPTHSQIFSIADDADSTQSNSLVSYVSQVSQSLNWSEKDERTRLSKKLNRTRPQLLDEE
jgi:hypothetical protein